MFVFWIGALLVAVIFILVLPLWRREAPSIPMGLEADQDQERVDLEIERQTVLTSLAELELDLAQGRLNFRDYERLKAIDEGRLARILANIARQPKEKSSAPPPKSAKPLQGWAMGRWAASALLSLLVIGGATSLYSHIHGKIGLEAQRLAAERQTQPSASGGGPGMPNPLEMVARLERRLRENPNDLEGQIMAGRSYMALQRLEDAKRAWSKVIELDYGNHEAHYYLGLILLNTARQDDPRVFEEALSHFETAEVKVPRDPYVLWYKGVALVHLRRFREADASWTEAFQNLPLGSEDAEFVKKQLESLRAGLLPQF